ncbi:MAG TPA: hypothetical protein PKM48_07090 [Parvularculaceae bacterium]|nr:hypothetical protein [Parvularculaceae bacterium]
MRCAIALVLLFSSMTPAAARPYDEIMAEARDAFIAEDFATAADLLDEAQIERPYSLYLTRNRVLTRILTDRMDEAIAIAAEIAERGLVLETPENEAFDRMRADPAFAPVAKRMAANAKPLGEARIIATFDEAGLLPEAISKKGDRLLIGAVRTGEIRDSSNALALFSSLDGGVFDIEQRRNAVYAAINNQLAYENKTDDAFAAVVELDGKTGAVLNRHRLNPGPSLIGDIEIDRKNRLYASDSLTPRIFELTLGGKPGDGATGIRAIEDPRFVNSQGIALDEKKKRLFLADYLAGLFVVDLKSNEITQIANPTAAHLGGIDGLYLYKGELIGIQNGTSPQRIVRVDLDKKGITATSLTVLQQALPEWNEPTHGVVDGDALYYIATSNWPAYDDEGNPRDGARLEPLRIMLVPLN